MKVHDTRTIDKEKGGDGEWGIFIDIFPLDDFPSSQVWKIACKRVSRIRHFVANQRFTRKMILTSSNGLKKNIAIIAGKLIHPFVSLHQLLISEMKAMKCYHMDENPFVSDLTDLSPILIPRSSVEERIHLTFESYSFWGPKDYDQWLTSLFGNYMELPPVAERVSNHMIEAFWIND